MQRTGAEAIHTVSFSKSDIVWINLLIKQHYRSTFDYNISKFKTFVFAIFLTSSTFMLQLQVNFKVKILK